MSAATRSGVHSLAEVLGRPGDPIRHGVGTLVSIDRLTGANAVLYRGTLLEDLPIIASSAELRLMQPDDPVSLHFVGEGESLTVLLVGRFVLPGTPAAGTALSVFADAITADEIITSEPRSLTSYGDLATVGPTLTDVLVGPSGKLIVLVGCTFNYGADDAAAGGEMTFEADGPTPILTSTGVTSHLAAITSTTAVTTTTVVDRKTLAMLSTDLLPGLYTLTAKYRATSGGVICNFSDRTLIAIAL